MGRPSCSRGRVRIRAHLPLECRVTNSARVNGSIPRRLLMLAFADIEALLCNGHDRMQLQEARIPKQLHGIEFACLFCLSHPGANPPLHRHLCLLFVFRCSLLVCATWCFIALCFTKICIVNFSSTFRWYGTNGTRCFRI